MLAPLTFWDKEEWIVLGRALSTLCALFHHTASVLTWRPWLCLPASVLTWRLWLCLPASVLTWRLWLCLQASVLIRRVPLIWASAAFPPAVRCGTVRFGSVRYGSVRCGTVLVSNAKSWAGSKKSVLSRSYFWYSSVRVPSGLKGCRKGGATHAVR